MRSRNRRGRNRGGNRVKLPLLKIIIVIALCFGAYKTYLYFVAAPKPVEESKYSSHSVVPLSVKKIKETLDKAPWCSVVEDGDSLMLKSTNKDVKKYLDTLSYSLIDKDRCGVALYKDGNDYVLSVPIKEGMAVVPAVSVSSMWNFIKNSDSNGDSDNNYE